MLNAPKWYIELMTWEYIYELKIAIVILLILVSLIKLSQLSFLNKTQEMIIEQNEEIIKNLETIEKQLLIMNDNMKNKTKNTSAEIYKENTDNTNRDSR